MFKTRTKCGYTIFFIFTFLILSDIGRSNIYNGIKLLLILLFSIENSVYLYRRCVYEKISKNTTTVLTALAAIPVIYFIPFLIQLFFQNGHKAQ